MRDRAEALLDQGHLAANGLLDPAPIRKCRSEHLSGHRNRQHSLWTVLMLNACLDHHQKGSGRAGFATEGKADSASATTAGTAGVGL
ncbi:MAG: hypothetical protein KDJ16_17405 [Hyphomicrobiales bacterium]|nr:hypothetical protein [Hyphomicrobiales bacterium]